jgi:hypothetical protein
MAVGPGHKRVSSCMCGDNGGGGSRKEVGGWKGGTEDEVSRHGRRFSSLSGLEDVGAPDHAMRSPRF